MSIEKPSDGYCDNEHTHGLRVELADTQALVSTLEARIIDIHDSAASQLVTAQRRLETARNPFTRFIARRAVAVCQEDYEISLERMTRLGLMPLQETEG